MDVSGKVLIQELIVQQAIRTGKAKLKEDTQKGIRIQGRMNARYNNLQC